MEIREEDIDQLLQARSEIDEELRRFKTEQTVLFTDIVGSTTYFDQFGDTEGLHLLYRHNSLVISAVEEFEGIVVKTIGDSVMAHFADPSRAAQAAIAIQQRLLQHNQTLARHERLQIRIGIHAGFGFRRANDLFGDTVNVAARITKQSGPAQILISQSVCETLPSSGIPFKTIGIVNLAGKTAAEELYEVIWTEEGAYDTLRRSLTGSSPKRDDFVQKSRALQAIDLLRGRIKVAIRNPPGVGLLRAAMLLVVYLTIAVGMFASRADTRQPTVREEPAPPKEIETVATPKLEEVVSSSIQQGMTPTPALTVSAVPLPDRTATPTVPEIAPVIKPANTELRSNWMTLIETVPVPAGMFMMGNDSSKADEKPRHQVRLDAFNMSRTEITNKQYLAFLSDTGYPRPRDPGFMTNYLVDYPEHPVVNVSYDDAIAFCAWASARFGASVRLPTEAEWEYAANAGKDGGPFPWGMEDPKTMARFKGNTPRGVPTVMKGAFPSNPFGLFNLSGNVWEWVQDFYSKDYYVTSPIRNPAGPTTGSKRLIRGGSWDDDDSALSTTRRANRSPGEHSDQIGFRVVVSQPRQLSPEARR